MDKLANHEISPSFDSVAEDLKRDGFAFQTGKDMQSLMQTRGVNHWPNFASSWDDLGLDVDMADGAAIAGGALPRSVPLGASSRANPTNPITKLGLQHSQRRDRALVYAGF